MFLVIAAVINIGLDLFFIVVLGTGVEGAAWATVISQLISGVGCLIYSIRHFEILHPEKEEMQVNKTYMMTLCGMGVPMGLQYSITAIGSVILQSAVNSLGSHAVAAMTAGSKIGMFFCCPFDALGSTMATYGGQNVGAKKLDRVSGGLKAGPFSDVRMRCWHLSLCSFSVGRWQASLSERQSRKSFPMQDCFC